MVNGEAEDGVGNDFNFYFQFKKLQIYDFVNSEEQKKGFIRKERYEKTSMVIITRTIFYSTIELNSL